MQEKQIHGHKAKQKKAQKYNQKIDNYLFEISFWLTKKWRKQIQNSLLLLFASAKSV